MHSFKISLAIVVKHCIISCIKLIKNKDVYSMRGSNANALRKLAGGNESIYLPQDQISVNRMKDKLLVKMQSLSPLKLNSNCSRYQYQTLKEA